jgi:hypothetical protein
MKEAHIRSLVIPNSRPMRTAIGNKNVVAIRIQPSNDGMFFALIMVTTMAVAPAATRKNPIKKILASPIVMPRNRG